MSGKKILYLCDYPMDLIGGAEKSTATMAKAMAANGYEVAILAENSLNKDTAFDNIRLYQFKKSANKYIQVLQKAHNALKYIRKFKPDIVHIQFAQYSYVFLLLKKFHLVKSKIRIIYTDRHYFEAYNDRYKNMYRSYSHYFNDVICTTENNKNCWKQAVGDNETPRLHVVQNVIEDEWFEDSTDKRNLIRNENGINDDTLVIGFVGRYVDWKRWDTVLDICERLKGKNIYFAVCISNPVGSNENSELNEYISKLEKASEGRLICRMNAGKEIMQQMYAAMDIFVLTSEFESFGRTLVEAMSKKTVVIATNSGGAPNVVGNEKNLFPVGDSQKACDIIERYEDKAILDEDKQAFYNRGKDLFSENNMISKMIKIYEMER
ncbi:glycosyltransferase family 4 protein [Eshraghiella crossota]|uniref:glycosyltransferase family 4 protein n=1 Tax=Eshraghiella crossota TaxID=45851 RepID=UPI000ECDAEB3|nr:glycosyltransferase family 4 protein [Butyrivibrio sp.]HAI92966.1 hypothetical protein [Butyrivibrio sp.]